MEELDSCVTSDSPLEVPFLQGRYKPHSPLSPGGVTGPPQHGTVGGTASRNRTGPPSTAHIICHGAIPCCFACEFLAGAGEGAARESPFPESLELRGPGTLLESSIGHKAGTVPAPTGRPCSLQWQSWG